METGELLSYGGGVNSTALVILMVNAGWAGPIVFADTGCEWPETYDYLEYFTREWLAPRGLEITVLGAEARKSAGGDERTLIEFCEARRIFPMLWRRWCTRGWKADVINHWAKERGLETQMLGIAADEAHRSIQHVRPLVTAGLTRNNCVGLIYAEGLSIPPKSSCYLCPLQQKHAWRVLYDKHPALFERVARLEESATERRGTTAYIDPHRQKTMRQMQMEYERDCRRCLSML